MFSLFHKKRHPSKFTGLAFAVLLFVFAAIAQLRPIVGLAGGGTVLIIIALLVEANRKAIWEDYKQSYKPAKDPLQKLLGEPKDAYYKANVYFIWPVVFLVGVASICVAYLLD